MRWQASLVLAVPLLGACLSSETVCRTEVNLVCDRVFQCQSEEVRATPQFQAVFGPNVAECKQQLYLNPLQYLGRTGTACADIQNDEQLCEDLGLPGLASFDLSRTRTCNEDRHDLTCEDFLVQLGDPTRAPADCNRRCK